MIPPNPDAAVESLAHQLATATGQSLQQVLPLAIRFGPAAAMWAASGEHGGALEELVVVAAGQAAILGIRLQAEFETFFRNALVIAGRAALGIITP